jgi:small subunit ribosomal protein S21
LEADDRIKIMAGPINVEVKLRNNESGERLIRRFIKKVKKEGIIEECRDRRYHEKVSDKKRRQKIRSKRLAKLAQEEKDRALKIKEN